MMKRSHAVIGAAAGVAVAHATGASMVAGGIVAALAGLLPDVDHPHAAVGRLLPPRLVAPAHRYPDHQRVSAIWAVGACAPTVPVSPGRRPVPASRFTAVCPVRPGLTSTPRAFRVSGPLPATTSAPVCVKTRAARLRAAFSSRSSTSPQRSHR
jgi:hypothetical protein